MTDFKRDSNRVPVSGGASSTDATLTLPFRVNPVTGRLLVDSISAGVSSAVFDTGSNLDVDTVAEQLVAASMPAIRGVLMATPVANTGVIYVGNADVTAGTTDATDGIPINAGETLFLEIDDANKLYVIGSAANQKIFYVVI